MHITLYQLQQGDASVQSKVKGHPRRGRLEDKAADTTAATWGGSTVTSEIEEGEKSPASSASLPSAILADTTQDSILPNASALAGVFVDTLSLVFYAF